MTIATEGYQIWVLCEDMAHYHFIRGFLIRLGVNKRKFELAADLPDGSGSGEQFVREQFPIALRKYARHKEKKLLAVVLDVDKEDRDPEKMRNTIHNIAKENGADGIITSDKLLLVFPKRNIETWFEWLERDSSERDGVNETEDYKQSHRNAKPGTLGKKAGEVYLNCRGVSDDNCVVLPSLQYARCSLKKLDELLTSIG